MGLFDPEYKTYVGTSVSRVVADDLLPKTAKASLLMSVFQNGTPSEYMMGALVTGLGIKTDQMYQYAQTHYPIGMPSKSTAFVAGSETKVLVALAGIIGSGVSMDYYHFGALNHLHYAWSQVIKLYGYDEAKNELLALSTDKKTPVYLVDLVSVVSDQTIQEITNGSLDFWGTPPTAGATPKRKATTITKWGSSIRPFTPLVVDPSVTQDYVKLKFAWKAKGPQTVNGITTQDVEQVFEDSVDILIPLPVPTDPAEYFQIRYRRNGVQGYYLYKLGTGQPALDSIFKADYKLGGTFFPNVYFRKKGQSTYVNKYNSVEYTSSVAMTKILGIDYEELREAIDANPNAQYIEQAMLSLGVPANSTDHNDQLYLFSFFDSTYAKVGGTTNTLDIAYKGTNPVSITIQDSIFRSILAFKGIYKETRGGVLGKVGATYGYVTNTGTVIDGSRKVTKVKSGKYTDDILDDTQAQTAGTGLPVHVYQRQITDSHYEVIHVVGMSMAYDIKNGYSTLGTKDDPTLLIPIDRELTSHLSLPVREMLYARSLHFVFNTYQVQTIQWYQQEWFGAVLMIVAIVITICDWGADGGSWIAAAAAATTAAGAAAVFLLEIIWYFVIQPAIVSAIFRVIVEAVGVEFAFLIALVAVLYAGKKIISAGSVKGAPYALELLQLSSGLVSGIGAQLKREYLELGKAYSSFEEYKKEKTEELDTASKLLEQSTLLNPIDLMGRTPTEYYDQTIHSGNIGPSAITATLNFVDISLTLPKFAETIES